MSLPQYTSYYWNKEINSLTADLPLVSSPYKISIIIFAYLYFVLNFGPQFMKRRPPYSFTTIMKLYNIVQIMANTWMTYDSIDAGLFSINFMCPILDNSNDYTSIRFARFLWYVLLIKILDLTETIIFVLRKKNNQISTLHLYHHVSTILIVWIAVRYYIAAPLVFLTILNCFVHVIMYTYYYLATWGPDIRKIVAPMKQWITIIQMIQFTMMILFVLQQLILNSCKIVDDAFYIIFIANVIINFYLFHQFYKQTYTKQIKRT